TGDDCSVARFPFICPVNDPSLLAPAERRDACPPVRAGRRMSSLGRHNRPTPSHSAKFRWGVVARRGEPRRVMRQMDNIAASVQTPTGVAPSLSGVEEPAYLAGFS